MEGEEKIKMQLDLYNDCFKFSALKSVNPVSSAYELGKLIQWTTPETTLVDKYLLTCSRSSELVGPARNKNR